MQEVERLINSTFLTNNTCKIVDELSKSGLNDRSLTIKQSHKVDTTTELIT